MQERKKKNGANRSNHCNVDVNDDIHETANTEFYFKRQENNNNINKKNNNDDDDVHTCST